MASTSSLSEKLMDIHLGTSTPQSSSDPPTHLPPYSSEDPTPSTKESNIHPTFKGSEPIRAALSNSETLPSAPPSEHLSPAALLAENIDTKDCHPEGPPPSYDSICVTQPKFSPTGIATISSNVPPPNNGWSHGGVAQPVPAFAQPQKAETDCCEDLLTLCYCLYCSVECCRCCMECVTLLGAFN